MLTRRSMRRVLVSWLCLGVSWALVSFSPTTRRYESRPRGGRRGELGRAQVAQPRVVEKPLEEYETVAVEASDVMPVRGTLFRLGPCDGEGQGALAAVTLDGTRRALARARYTRTRGYLQWERTGEKASSEAPKAVRCLYWAGRLFALQDKSGLPYQMEPLSLGTQKQSDLGAQAEDGFDPRYRVLGDRLLNVATAGGGPMAAILGPARLEIDEFNANFKRVSKKRFSFSSEQQKKSGTLSLKDLIDWAPTPNFYVALVEAGAHTRVLAARRETDTPEGAPAPVERDADIADVASAPLKGRRPVLVNCFEVGDELVLDVLASGHLTRVVLGPTSQLETRQLAADARLCAPRVFGADRGAFVARGPTLAFLAAPGDDHDDTWTHSTPDAVLGLPTVLDDGALLLLAHLPDRTDLVFFSNYISLNQGPHAVLTLPARLPATDLDGPFVPDLTPSLEDIHKAETLTRLYAKKAREWNEMEGGFSGLGIKSFFFPDKGVAGG